MLLAGGRPKDFIRLRWTGVKACSFWPLFCHRNTILNIRLLQEIDFRRVQLILLKTEPDLDWGPTHFQEIDSALAGDKADLQC